MNGLIGQVDKIKFLEDLKMNSQLKESAINTFTALFINCIFANKSISQVDRDFKELFGLSFDEYDAEFIFEIYENTCNHHEDVITSLESAWYNSNIQSLTHEELGTSKSGHDFGMAIVRERLLFTADYGAGNCESFTESLLKILSKDKRKAFRECIINSTNPNVPLKNR